MLQPNHALDRTTFRRHYAALRSTGAAELKQFLESIRKEYAQVRQEAAQPPVAAGAPQASRRNGNAGHRHGTRMCAVTSPTCPFCNFDQPEVTVFADGHVQAFINLSPINRYHVLVVPRVHYERLADVPPEILMSVMRTVQRVSVAVRTVARPDAISHVSDDDLTGCGFNLVAHWKMHVIPRYKNDAVVIDWRREPDPGKEARARYGSELRQALLRAPIAGNAGV